MTKVLFLDIDGVCNSQRTMERYRGFIGIDPQFAERIKKIIEDTGCKVVLSSTWRLDESSRREVKRKVCDFIDVTPNLHGSRYGGVRGEEIQDWLDRHPEVTRYAILDDDADMLESQQKSFFQTSFRTGITQATMVFVIDHLNKEVLEPSQTATP